VRADGRLEKLNRALTGGDVEKDSALLSGGSSPGLVQLHFDVGYIFIVHAVTSAIAPLEGLINVFPHLECRLEALAPLLEAACPAGELPLFGKPLGAKITLGFRRRIDVVPLDF
jgi:hypothetical protein